MSGKKKQPVLTWTDLSRNDVSSIQKLGSMEERRLYLCHLLSMNEDNDRDTPLLDLYSRTVEFCIEQELLDDKLSAFFSILMGTHSTSMSKNLPLEDAYELFKSIIVRHCVHRPPFSVQVFTLDETKLLQEFAMKEYFRQYKLFVYSFAAREEVNFTTFEYECISPKPLPPLSDAISIEEFEAKKQAALEEQMQKEEEDRQTMEEAEKIAEEQKELVEEQTEEDREMGDKMKKNLDVVHEQLKKQTENRLEQIESVLAQLEEKVGIKKT